MLFLIPLVLSAAGGGAVTYYAMRGHDLPQEVKDIISKDVFQAKYVEMMLDDKRKGHEIVMDKDHRRIHDLNTGETFIEQVDSDLPKDNQYIMAKMVTDKDNDRNAKPAFTHPNGWRGFWHGVNLFDWTDDRTKLGNNENICIEYRDPTNPAVNRAYYVKVSAQRFEEEKQRAVEGYRNDVDIGKLETTKAILDMAEEFNRTPTKLTPEDAEYFSNSKVKEYIEGLFKDRKMPTDRFSSIDISTLPYEEKCIIFKRLLEEKKMDPRELSFINLDSGFKATAEFTKIKIDPNYVNTPVVAAQQEIAANQPKVDTAKQKQQEQNGGDGDSNPFSLVHDHPWIALGTAIAMIWGGSKIGGITGVLGAGGAIALVIAAIKEITKQNGAGLMELFSGAKHKAPETEVPVPARTSAIDISQTVQKAEDRANGKTDSAEPAFLNGGQELVAVNDEKSAAGALLYLNAVGNARQKKDSPTLLNIPGTSATNLDPALAAQGAGVAIG